ncbi:hypothetical protein Tco_0611772 [Tanacetum coccineum]
MSMWIISRGVVLLILLMMGISFKFDISGLLHQVITTIAYRIRDKDTSQSKQNLQSSSMTFIHKTLIIPSVLDSCFISSTVSEVKRIDQNAAKCVDERAALANLIANLTLDTEENKTIQKQLKKANASLTQELKECKTNLDESSRALGEATSSRDSSLIALQNKQTELEKYTALNDLTSEYKILQTKLNETLGLLALKDIQHTTRFKNK